MVAALDIHQPALDILPLAQVTHLRVRAIHQPVQDIVLRVPATHRLRQTTVLPLQTTVQHRQATALPVPAIRLPVQDIPPVALDTVQHLQITLQVREVIPRPHRNILLQVLTIVLLPPVTVRPVLHIRRRHQALIDKLLGTRPTLLIIPPQAQAIHQLHPHIPRPRRTRQLPRVTHQLLRPIHLQAQVTAPPLRSIRPRAQVILQHLLVTAQRLPITVQRLPVTAIQLAITPLPVLAILRLRQITHQAVRSTRLQVLLTALHRRLLDIHPRLQTTRRQLRRTHPLRQIIPPIRPATLPLHQNTRRLLQNTVHLLPNTHQPVHGTHPQAPMLCPLSRLPMAMVADPEALLVIPQQVHNTHLRHQQETMDPRDPRHILHQLQPIHQPLRSIRLKVQDIRPLLPTIHRLPQRDLTTAVTDRKVLQVDTAQVTRSLVPRLHLDTVLMNRSCSLLAHEKFITGLI